MTTCDKHIFAPLGMTQLHHAAAAARRRSRVRWRRATSRARTRRQVRDRRSRAGRLAVLAPAPTWRSSCSRISTRARACCRPTVAATMHNSPLDKVNPVSLLPPLNRMELGFFETNINGREVIGHLGDTEFFHTSLHLLMKEKRRHLLLVQQRRGREAQRPDFALVAVRGLRRPLFPGEHVPRMRRSMRKRPLSTPRMMAGNWQVSRTALQQLRSPCCSSSAQTKVAVGPKGGLLIPELLGANKLPRRVGRDRAVRLAREGRARPARRAGRRTARWSAGASACSRPSWCSIACRRIVRRAGSCRLLRVSLGVLLLTVLFWPIGWFARRTLPRDDPARRHRAARLQVDALGIVGCRARHRRLGGDDRRAVRQPRKPVGHVRCDAVVLQIVGLIAFIGAVVIAGWNAWLTWRDGRRWTAKTVEHADRGFGARRACTSRSRSTSSR